MPLTYPNFRNNQTTFHLTFYKGHAIALNFINIL